MMKLGDDQVLLKAEWESPFYTLEATVGSRRVGSLVAVMQSEASILLSDVKVGKDVAMAGKRSGILGWLQPKPQVASFRGRGIGNMMLRHFIGWCHDEGITEVFGTIVQSDIEETPWLLDWYRRNGFEVRPPDERALRNAVHMVFWRNGG